jgi:linoleate 10R-lipoxygenase
MLLKQRVKDHVQELTHLIKSALDGTWKRIPFAGIFDTLSSLFGVKGKNHNEIVKRLFEFGCSTEHVVNSILALLVGATIEMSLGMPFLFLLVGCGYQSPTLIALTNVINQLLDAENNITAMQDLSSLTAYVLEALSACSIPSNPPLLIVKSGIDPPFAGVYRVAKQDEMVVSLYVQEGERLFLDVAAANMNVSCSYPRLCTSLIRDI